MGASEISDFRIYFFLVALVGSNAISHIRGTMQKKQYCPGTISGSFLLLPLLLISYTYFLIINKVDILSAIVCFCFGVFIGFYVAGVDIRKQDSHQPKNAA